MCYLSHRVIVALVRVQEHKRAVVMYRSSTSIIANRRGHKCFFNTLSTLLKYGVHGKTHPLFQVLFSRPQLECKL